MKRILTSLWAGVLLSGMIVGLMHWHDPDRIPRFLNLFAVISASAYCGLLAESWARLIGSRLKQETRKDSHRDLQ